MSVARARQPSDAPSSWGNQPPHRSLSDRRENPASSPMRIVCIRKRPSPRGAIGGACPKRLTKAIGDEAAALQPLGEQAQAGAVPVKDLQIVTSLATKNEDVAGIGVGLKNIRDLRGQAVEAVTHADRPGREIDLGARRDLDHARSFNARSTRRRARSLTNASTRTRAPAGRSTSITPGRSSSFAALPADRERAARDASAGALIAHHRRPFVRRTVEHTDRDELGWLGRGRNPLAANSAADVSLTAPAEQQVGVDVVTLRYRRDRSAGQQRLLDNPPLLLISPGPAHPPCHLHDPDPRPSEGAQTRSCPLPR